MKRICFILLVACGCATPHKKADLIIRSASIIDVASGNVIHHKAIAILADSIESVFDESDLGQYQADRTIDASGKFIIPGLWDMHVHFGGGDTLTQENKNLLPLYVANGITAVRDCAADLSPSVLQWREEIAKGKLFGPTIFTSGPKLEGFKSVWVGDIEIDSEEDMMEAIDLLQQMNVDFIKITDNTLKPDLYLRILKEATKRGIKTSAHIPFALTLAQVSEEGLGTVEHGSYLLKGGSSREEELGEKVAAGTLAYRDAMVLILESFDEETALASYKKMAKNGTAVVPTLTISYTLAYLDQNDHREDDYLNYIGPGLKKTYEGRIARASKDDTKAVAARHQVYEKAKSILPIVQKAGMKIIAGTDAGYLNSFVYPGFALHQELELFVQAGLTPLQALQSTIVNGPWFLKKDKEFGAIEAGRVADLLILNQDPLSDIRNTRDINAVILKGKLLDRAALDSLLTDVKKAAQ